MLTKLAENLYVDLDKVSVIALSAGDAKGTGCDLVVDGFRFIAPDSAYKAALSELAQSGKIKEM